jgi:hypothetical protein
VPTPPAVLVDTPFTVVRRWKASPLAGVTSIEAWREVDSSVSRIITPAFVQAWTYCTLTTWLTMVPSPVMGT